MVDDIYGANFNVDPPSGDCMDIHGHGTHVSGVIGAVGNNVLGIAGINQVRYLFIELFASSHTCSSIHDCLHMSRKQGEHGAAA